MTPRWKTIPVSSVEGALALLKESGMYQVILPNGKPYPLTLHKSVSGHCTWWAYDGPNTAIVDYFLRLGCPIQVLTTEGEEPTVWHDLKMWPEYFEAVLSGAKPFEMRRNDRGFEVGHGLRLVEWSPISDSFTGRVCKRRVTYILEDAEDFGLAAGFAVLGMAEIGDSSASQKSQVAKERGEQ